MVCPWVIFTMDGVWGVYPTKRTALAALHSACLEDRRRPPCRLQPDGTYQYEPPADRNVRHTYWLTDRQSALDTSGVDMEAVAVMRERKALAWATVSR